MKILLGQVPVWLFFILELVAILVAAFFYAGNREGSKLVFHRLFWTVLGLKLLKPAFFTWSQWYVWHASRPEFLALPLAGDLKLLGWLNIFSFLKSVAGGYFIFYSFGRFWLSTLIALAAATLWWLVLKLLVKRRPKAMRPEEQLLAWVTAAIAGWPGFVLYVPMSLALAAVGILYLTARKIDLRLPIGWPMIIASLLVAVAGTFLIGLLDLSVYKI